MNIQLKKWGNSLGLRIPHKLSESLGLNENTEVEILEIDNCLVIRKKQTPLTLNDLLASIPSDFQYPDDVQDFVNSPAVGQEIL